MYFFEMAEISFHINSTYIKTQSLIYIKTVTTGSVRQGAPSVLGFHITYENHKIVIILRTTTNLPCHRGEPRSGSSSGRSGRLKELDSVRESHVHMDIKASGDEELPVQPLASLRT